MKLVKNPNSWSCLLASFAMVLDMTCQELIEKLGHDGSERIFGGIDPYCRKAFHYQEFYPIVNAKWLKMEYLSGTISRTNGREVHSEPFDLLPYIKHNKMILLVPEHAVATDGTMIFDPRGSLYPIENFLTSDIVGLIIFK